MCNKEVFFAEYGPNEVSGRSHSLSDGGDPSERGQAPKLLSPALAALQQFREADGIEKESHGQELVAEEWESGVCSRGTRLQPF